MNRKETLETLDDTVKEFEEIYNNINLKFNIYDKWDIKDILCHITYWHTIYSNILNSLTLNKTPKLLSGTYRELNEQGVKSMRKYSKEKLLKTLKKSHTKFHKLILNPKIRKIPYRQDSRKYAPLEYMGMINSHIQGHVRDLNKIKRQNYGEPNR